MCPVCDSKVVVGINIKPGGESQYVAFCSAMSLCDSYLSGKIGKGATRGEAEDDFERQCFGGKPLFDDRASAQ